MCPCYIYILTNKHRTAFYTGMTCDLVRRMSEHRSGTGSMFTSFYRVRNLIYFEEHPTRLDALAREKEIKGWRREKKLALVRAVNPELATLDLDWL